MGETFRTMGIMCQKQKRTASPYAVRLPSGQVVDASCLRGLAAFINSPKGIPQRRSNVKLSFGTVNLPRDEGCFGSPVTNHGLCRVRNRRWKNWKRMPQQLIHAINKQSLPWILATRTIVVGEELLMIYRNPDVCKINHHTQWVKNDGELNASGVAIGMEALSQS